MEEYIIYFSNTSLTVFFFIRNRIARKALSKEIIDHAVTKSDLSQSETKREYFKNLAFKRKKQ